MILRWRTTTSASPSLDPTVQALRGAAIDAQRSRLPQMAAALSYRTVFGMLPILAVALWVLHSQLDEKELEYYVGKGLDLLGLTGITIDSAAAETATNPLISDPESVIAGAQTPPEVSIVIPAEDLPAASDNIVGPPPPADAPTTVPKPGSLAESQSLQTWIKDFVKQIKRVSFGAIGLVGVGMLIYAALGMVVEIERAFNQIFRVPHGRSWTRRLVNYWTLLTLGVLGLVGTFFLQQQFNDWVQGWTNGGMRFGSGTGAAVLTMLGFVTQLVISAGVLLLLYMVVPNTRVRVVPALWGALFAATIFEGSKFAFSKYVQFSAGQSYTRLYGSLALIPLFLLWVYFTWLIVLFGMQLTYQLQHGRRNTRAQPLFEFGPSVVEPTSALSVMSAVARAFSAGATIDAPDIARQARLSDGIVRVILATLCERNLLHRLEAGGGGGEVTEESEPTYALAKSADAIRVSELLSVGYELARRKGGDEGAEGESEESAVMRRLRQAQIAAAGDETLAEVIGSGGTPAGQGTPTRPPTPAAVGAIVPGLPRASGDGNGSRAVIVPLAPEPADGGGAHTGRGGLGTSREGDGPRDL